MSPPLVPGMLTHDTTVHIVLNDNGELGAAYVETDEAKAGESAVISKIINGEYSNPIRVVAFNTHGGWSCDVTEYVAQTILDLNRQGTLLSAIAIEFVERVTGKSPTVTV